MSRPLIKLHANLRGYYESNHRVARECLTSLRHRIEQGETVYLVGLGLAGHNSGTALVEASKSGIRFVANNEEERYTQIKHCPNPPVESVEVVKRQLAERGVKPDEVHAYVGSMDIIDFIAQAFSEIVAELPGSVVSLQAKASPTMTGENFSQVVNSAVRLTTLLGLSKRLPIIGLRHHDNHAYFSYAASPFAKSQEPVLIATIDGMGDDGAVTIYQAQGEDLRVIYNNKSSFDSAGLVYQHLSSSLGGWTVSSSEGRYMGAAAWGNGDRFTNPYYLQLRQLAYFAPGGEIFINRKWANWQKAGVIRPFTKYLSEVVGEPVPLDQMWNPDAILNVEQIQHSPITQDRVDKAAALQMLFEDMLFHILGYWIRSTGISKMVLTGGAALNCVANMRLMEHFNEAFYERYTGKKNVRLQIWVPPIPSDAGAPVGAAYHFAMKAGVPTGEPLQHAFYCGDPPTSNEICEAVRTASQIGCIQLGSVEKTDQRDVLADLLAYLISQGAVIGLFQGAGETGPRALGHRSILSNPCNPKARDHLNQLVKFRELVRPLAPMATLEAAQRWFNLSAGAAAGDYNAYNYMVLTAPAKPEAFHSIPAVIHADGTSRVQIVRAATDPFCHAYLKAMGRRVGVEVSVNTSLNVGSPIVQTPAQALECLKRSKGLTALFMIGADGVAHLTWHDTAHPPKDAGQRLRTLVDAWCNERRVTLPV